jgi:Glycosyl hydrolase family 71
VLRVFVAAMLALAAETCSAQSSSATMTTLDLQTKNNTSASNKFHGSENGNAAPGHVSKLPLRSLLYPGTATKIYARVVPFFLPSQRHINVGYKSGDQHQVRRQVEDMISRGIDGAIIDWYGTEHPDLGKASAAFRDEAESHPGFSFAISVDKGALKECQRRPGCDLTRRLIDDLNFAYDHFEKSSAYLVQDGRPVVFFFDVNQVRIDWPSVRNAVDGNPLFIFRNIGAFNRRESDGAFSWVDQSRQPEMPEMDKFYRKAVNVTSMRPMLAIPSVYKGFDDRIASWSEHRVTAQSCGQTWLDTFARVNQYYSSTHPLDYLQVVTWNDYEEGTEIEAGIDNCVEIEPSVSGTTISWNISGNQNAIDHFTIYASLDGKRLVPLTEVPADARQWELRSREMPAAHYRLYVQAVGKPSFIDRMSGPVSWTRGK